MTPRERVTKTLKHEPVDRTPRDLWSLPGIGMFRPNELETILAKYPLDFTAPRFRYGPARRAKGQPCEVGQYTDAWGCTWHVAERGVIGEVKEPLLKNWSDLAHWQPPRELLDEADLREVNQSCSETDKFVLVGTETRPFERLQFLRGSENILMDLAYGTREVHQLLEMLHEFYCREMRMWADTDVDGVSFMDDWGTQQNLLISPQLWRDIFKPLYREYCRILHAQGKYAFFHSDGQISAIYPDLIEIGIDAVNSQLFCMDIETLGQNFSGKITFWGEIDRQKVLPFGSPEEVRSAVRRVRQTLDRGNGGLIAQCEWGMDVTAENIKAVFDEWNIDSK
jgi:uroporphyrinogen decarboxylase